MIGAQSLRQSYPPDADLVQPNPALHPAAAQPLTFADTEATLRQLQVAESQRDFLKTYSARLEAELKAYQMKFPDVLVAIESDSDDLSPWTINQQYISPLLIAYDSQLAQANAANADLRRDLQQLKTEVNRLGSCNENLEAELENNIAKLLRRFDDGNGAEGFLDSNELHELNQRCALLGDENHLLRTQELESRRELDGVRSALDDREAIINSMRNDINRYKLDVSKMQEMKAHIDALEQELVVTRKQSEDAIKHMKSAQEDSLQLQVELQRRSKDAEQFQQLLKENESEGEKCIQELKSELTSLHAQFTTASGEAAHLNQLLQDALEQNKQQKRIIDSKEADLQGMLSTVKALEDNLDELSGSNLKLTSELGELKCSFLEATLRRDEALLSAEHGERQRKSENDHLSEALESLRKSSSETLSKALASAKTQQARLYEEIKQLQIKCAQLESSKDTADRNAKSASQNLQHFQETALRVQNEMGDTLNEARAQIVRLESRLEAMMKKDGQLETELKALSGLYGDEKSAFEEKLSQMVESLKVRRAECQTLNEKLNQAENDLRGSKDAILKEITKRNSLQAQLQEQYRALKTSKDQEIAALHDRIQDLNDIRDRNESSIIRIQRESDDKIQQIQLRLSSQINELQKTIRDCRDQIAIAQGAQRTLESEAEQYREYISELKQQLETSRKQASELRSAMTALEQDTVDKDIHLQRAHEEEQSLKRRIQHLESTLDKAEVAVSRERRQWEKKFKKLELKVLGISVDTNGIENPSPEGSLAILN